MDFDTMMKEIHSESLQSLLTTVRSQASPPLDVCSSTNSPPEPQESPLGLLRSGDVLEIQGPPASGKTHLLYLLMISCIMPTAYSSISLGGWDKAVLLFDTDASFDLARFTVLLRSRLKSRAALNDLNIIESLVDRSLQNLRLFRPSSSMQLSVTLLHLPAYHRTKLPNTEIGIVAVDSISAFYWPDCFTAEQLRPNAYSRKGADILNPLHYVLTALYRFHETHKPMIVLTNWGLTPAKTENPESREVTYRQHLHPPPAVFEESGDPSLTQNGLSNHRSLGTLPLTHQITLSARLPSQFPPDFLFADNRALEFSKGSKMDPQRGAVGSIQSASRLGTVSQFALIIESDHLEIV